MHQLSRISAVLVIIVVMAGGQRVLGDSEEPRSQAVSRKSAVAARLIAKLSSPTITAPEMEQAEFKLQRMVPEVVVPLLVPKIVQGMPGVVIYNGTGSAKGDASFPPKWKAFYSYRCVWNEVAPRKVKLTGRLLAERLSTVTTSREESVLITQLNRYWDETTEKSIAETMHRFDDGRSPWLQAARCLMRHKRKQYYGDLKRIVKKLPDRTWHQMLTKASTLELLLSKRAGARRRNEIGVLTPQPLPPSDPELVVIGFRLLKAMEHHEAGFGRLLAGQLGDYVGCSFEPPRKNDNDQAKHGVTDKYSAEYAENGLDWWRENKQRYLQQL